MCIVFDTYTGVPINGKKKSYNVFVKQILKGEYKIDISTNTYIKDNASHSLLTLSKIAH